MKINKIRKAALCTGNIKIDNLIRNVMKELWYSLNDLPDTIECLTVDKIIEKIKQHNSQNWEKIIKKISIIRNFIRECDVKW